MPSPLWEDWRFLWDGQSRGQYWPIRGQISTEAFLLSQAVAKQSYSTTRQPNTTVKQDRQKPKFSPPWESNREKAPAKLRGWCKYSWLLSAEWHVAASWLGPVLGAVCPGYPCDRKGKNKHCHIKTKFFTQKWDVSKHHSQGYSGFFSSGVYEAWMHLLDTKSTFPK